MRHQCRLNLATLSALPSIADGRNSLKWVYQTVDRSENSRSYSSLHLQRKVFKKNTAGRDILRGGGGGGEEGRRG